MPDQTPHNTPTEPTGGRLRAEQAPNEVEFTPTPDKPSGGHAEPRDTFTTEQWADALTRVGQAVRNAKRAVRDDYALTPPPEDNRHARWQAAFDNALSPNDHTSPDDLATLGIRQADIETASLIAERDQARRWAVALENQLAAVRAMAGEDA